MQIPNDQLHPITSSIIGCIIGGSHKDPRIKNEFLHAGDKMVGCISGGLFGLIIYS